MKTVRIRFINPAFKIPDDWLNDQTEFDVEDDGELAVLFFGFLYENNLIEIDRDD